MKMARHIILKQVGVLQFLADLIYYTNAFCISSFYNFAKGFGLFFCTIAKLHLLFKIHACVNTHTQNVSSSVLLWFLKSEEFV